ncbi:hypothetical protein [Rhizobium sp. SL86]|uniref:hypothetical protein n=1 Tax=Rhizobium sp. SL86 TaxID=2995148 RepID=UPI0022734A2E|nr:hypothetical protein [Rhizobium sp. SL86]MCY1665175.1 hypothetical protein [Rhizobium sp. SL86]
MSKIVREHYPVDRLPEDLREGLEPGATVRVVLEVENVSVERQPMGFAESMRLINEYRRDNAERVSIEDAVRRIRELRDEWDER